MKRIVPIFRGQIENGIIHLEDTQSYNEYLKTLQGEIEVVVREKRKIRSLSQNSLYWVYLNLIAEETAGDTSKEYLETLHNRFKEEFIQPDEVELYGKKTKRYKTTTKMSPLEFSNYIKSIEQLTGILCPDKNDYETVN